MLCICDCVEKCENDIKEECAHSKPHEITYIYEDGDDGYYDEDDEKTCDEYGNCNGMRIRCVEYVRYHEIDFEIEGMFEID